MMAPVFPICLAAIVSVLCMLNPGTAAADISLEVTQKYFDGLRQRRLFTVAETVCLRKLNDTRLSVTERAWYSVELSRTFASHAMFASSADEEQELLDRARKLPDALLANSPEHPQSPLLRSQSLFVSAGQVETLRLRLELTPFADALRAKALKLAEETSPALTRLEKEIGDEIRSAPRDVLGNRLKPFQLRGLQRIVKYRLASLLLDQSLLLPTTSPDRAEALALTADLFRKLAAGEPGVLVTWQSQLGILRTNRLRGDLASVARMIEAIEKDAPPEEILDEVIAEKIELLHRERKYASALEELRQWHSKRHQLTGRLTWLAARTQLELWTLARDRGEPDLAQSLMQQASAFVVRAQTDPGGYWGEKCRLLLSTATVARTYGPIIGPVVQKAQTRFAEGKTKVATQLYADAFKLAREAKPPDADIAAEIGHTLASMLLKINEPAKAAQVFGEVVELKPDSHRAPGADLLRAYSLGLVYRTEPTKPRREAYVTALNIHREQFAESKTAHEATWYLARLQERRLQTTKALQLYQSIPPSHARGGEAQIAVARCAESILKRLRKLSEPADQWESAINRWLMTTTVPMMKADEPLANQHAELLLLGARIRLSQTQPDFAGADQFLNRVLTATPPEIGPEVDAATVTRYTVTAEQQSMARQFRIVSLAGTGRVTEAEAILSKAISQGPNQLLVLLDGLSAATAGQSVALQTSLGQLQLDAVRRSRIDVTRLPAEKRVPFFLRIAEASELAGKLPEAADTYSRLIRERPNDLAVRRSLARIRSTLPGKANQQRAKEHWKKIEARYKAGTNEWMEARVEIIRCHVQLGEDDLAKKLLTVTQLLYRNSGTAETRQRLASIVKQLQQN